LKIFNRINEAIGLGLLRACHDLSEGGMAVALAEMAFAGGFGAEIKLRQAPCNVKRNEVILFAESNTRFIAEVRKEDQKKFEGLMKGVAIGLLGRVSGEKDFEIYGIDTKKIISTDIDKLKETWQRPLCW
jgi:phosphoribosylformylglycinamidine synthase